MKNNLHVFLGATVADAAARPLHWVYNQKKLLTYIKGKKDFTFLTRNKSPFYKIIVPLFTIIICLNYLSLINYFFLIHHKNKIKRHSMKNKIPNEKYILY